MPRHRHHRIWTCLRQTKIIIYTNRPSTHGLQPFLLIQEILSTKVGEMNGSKPATYQMVDYVHCEWREMPTIFSLSLSLVSWRIASGSVTTRNRNDPFPTGNTYMSCFKSRSGFFWIYFRPPEYKWSQGFWDVFFGEDPSPISTSPRMRLAFF